MINSKHMTISQRGIAPLILVVIAAVAFVGGSTGIVAAANSAKPGDFLYPIDTAVEDIRIAITSGEGEVELRTDFAAERVQEIEELLEERGVEAPCLDIALTNLTEHHLAIADLAVAEAELKARAKVIEDTLEQQEKQLEAAFDALKTPLKAQKKQFGVQLEAAIEAGNVELAGQLAQQISQVKTQLRTIETQEEAAEEALEAAEERLEALLEAEEKAL